MELTGLSAYCGNNIPGLFDLQYVPTTFVNKESYLRGYKDEYSAILDQFYLLSGKSFLQAPVIHGRNSYTETESQTEFGKMNTCTLSVFMPYDNEEINTELARMAHFYYIIKWRDPSGQLWTLGTIQTPCSFSKKFDNGTKLGSSKGYTLTWTCKTLYQRKKINGVTS